MAVYKMEDVSLAIGLEDGIEYAAGADQPITKKFNLDPVAATYGFRVFLEILDADLQGDTATFTLYHSATRDDANYTELGTATITTDGATWNDFHFPPSGGDHPVYPNLLVKLTVPATRTVTVGRVSITRFD